LLSLTELTAHELKGLLDKGEVSSKDIVKEHLERIEKVEKKG
jgi:Asp-tRNA(Asn)/Glu-tRNA(Gln) amidotransferase A subunit family amidase